MGYGEFVTDSVEIYLQLIAQSSNSGRTRVYVIDVCMALKAIHCSKTLSDSINNDAMEGRSRANRDRKQRPPKLLPHLV